MSVKRVGILYHPMKKAAYIKATELQEFLSSRGVSAWLCSAWETGQASAQVDGTDLVLSIGGDGTILRSAQAVVPRQIPITGINLGQLGFMTELSAAEALDKLPALLAGDGWIDERAMLEVEAPGADGEPARLCHALNDAVVARGAVARMVSIEASIDGQPLTTYKADGAIVATATGSTGYSLAAGGPILHPQAVELVLLPVMPHLSFAHSLVLPSTATVRLRVSTTHQAMLSVDGHTNLPLADGAIVIVKRSRHTTRFLRALPRTSFYGSLEQRLKGKN